MFATCILGAQLIQTLNATVQAMNSKVNQLQQSKYTLISKYVQ